MVEEALGKTDDGFDIATFVQQFNQFSPEYGRHFKGNYRHMRAHCPVAHTDEVGGFWVVTRYADIMRVARDYETFSSRYGVFTSNVNPDTPRAGFGPHGEERTGPLAAYPPGPNGEAPRLRFLPLELDPPLHGQYRKAIDPLFSPHSITALAPWLLALTDQLIDAIIEKGEGDFSRDLRTPMASIYTMKCLGLPLEDWSDHAWFIQSATGGSSSVQPRTKDLSERELRQRVAAEVVQQDPATAGDGGDQSLMVSFQKRIDRASGSLDLTDDDLRRIQMYAFKYGNGGWEDRLEAAFGRTLGPKLDGVIA